jgi:hypothetical protein
MKENRMKPSAVHITSPRRRLLAMPAPRTLSSLLLAALFVLLALSDPAANAQKALPDYGKVPLSFEPNRGQTDPHAQFLSRGPGYALFLSPQEAVLSLQTSKPANKPNANGIPVVAPAKTSTLRMQILGANPAAMAKGQQSLPGTANYFQGTDQTQWKTAIPTFQRVSYTAIYPGVDLIYYGNQRQLEYDFVVAPGADPNRIALGFHGATPRVEASTGDLVLAIAGSQTRFHKPVVYQLEGTRKTPISGNYTIANNQVHFALGSYDKSKTLVIDPVLSYATYIGGTFNDLINGIAVDAAGNTYIVATTQSADYPTKNPYQSISPGIANSQGRRSSMVVSKLNATGTALVYSTYLGSTDSTEGFGIAVDSGGNAYVVGDTTYGTYPVTPGAFQTICGGNYTIPAGSPVGVRANGCVGAGQGDLGGVLTKLNPTGTGLVYSTYLSGNNYNSLRAVAVNAAGEAYVTGSTNSFCNHGVYNPNGTGYQAYFCFPFTSGAAQNGVADSIGGGGKVFATFTKFDAAGASLIYSSLLGPTTDAQTSAIGYSVAVDPSGAGYMSGTSSNNLFTTSGSYQPAVTGNRGSFPFVAKFDPTAKKLVYSTFVAGPKPNLNNSIAYVAVDAAGSAYLAGSTDDCSFPTTAGAYQTMASFPPGFAGNCHAGFVTKLNPAGTALVWSTFLGNASGSGNTAYLSAIALGADNSVYVTGNGVGGGYPSLNPVLPQSQFSTYPIITRLNPAGSALLFSTTLSGTSSASDFGTGIAVDGSGNMYIAGQTNSYTFPVTPGAFQLTNHAPNGNVSNGFVAKIAPTLTTTTALTLPTGTVTAGQSVKLTAKVTGQTGSTAAPTGTVTFLGGTTTLGTGTLDSTGTATYTAPSLNATTYSITASYAGDTAFSASVSAAQNLVVSPATPNVTLTTPATALVGAPVTLAVTVTGTGGTPTGTITFKDGTATLGTATLATGAASYSTSTLTTGAHTITASYSGDSIFAATTSAASNVTINVPATISIAATPNSLTIVHGSSGSVVITGTPTGGYTGTLTFACGTLPTAATCAFAPTSLSFTGNNTPQSTTLTLSTITTAALEYPPLGHSNLTVFAASLFMPLGFLIHRRNRSKLRSMLLLVLLVASSGIVGITGCGSSGSTNSKTVTTPIGSYSIAVNLTTASGTTTLSIPVTVQ